MKYLAFNGDGERIGDGAVVEYATRFLTIGGVLEGLTASGLTHSATTVQLVHHGELVAMATRTAADGLGRYAWMVQDFIGATTRYQPDAALPADGPITR